MRNQLTVLSEWFLFSIFMFTLPFLSYFGSKHLLEIKYPEVTQDNAFLSTVIPVAAAVLTVWIIIATYAYIAWRDEFRSKSAREQQQAVKASTSSSAESTSSGGSNKEESKKKD